LLGYDPHSEQKMSPTETYGLLLIMH